MVNKREVSIKKFWCGIQGLKLNGSKINYHPPKRLNAMLFMPDIYKNKIAV